MPAVPVVLSLYGGIVRTHGGTIRPTIRFYELERAAISMLTHANPRMLIVDEFKRLLSCSAREQRAALNTVTFLSNERLMTIVAAGTHEALHVMRFDPQISSRFEQMQLPVRTESEELHRFIAVYLAMPPKRRNPGVIDQRFIEYLLALTDGVTGRIVDLLRRVATDALTHKSKSVRIDQLLITELACQKSLISSPDFRFRTPLNAKRILSSDIHSRGLVCATDERPDARLHANAPDGVRPRPPARRNPASFAQGFGKILCCRK
jgi:hypothetical protein